MLGLLQQLQGSAPPPTAPPPAAALPGVALPRVAPPPAAQPPPAAPRVIGEPSRAASGDDAAELLSEFVGQRPQLGGLRALVFEVLEDAGPQAP